MPKRKSFQKSLLIHMALALVMLMFVFERHSTNRDNVPLEIQLNDVHVHRVEKAPPPKKHEEAAPSLHPVKKAAEEPEPTPAPVWEQFSQGQKNEYLASLIRLISAHKHYPQASIANEEEGVVQIKVALDETGKLLNSEVSKSSGYSRLDEAALKTIREIGTYPLPSPNTKGIVLFVPIRYEMNPNH